MAPPQFPEDLVARLSHLADTRAELLRALDAVTADVTAPTGLAAEWNAAEIAYHLHLSEKSIAKLLQKRLAAADRGVPAADEQLRAEWDRVARLVGLRQAKVKAPEVADPKSAPPLRDGIELLQQSRQALLEVLRSAAYTDLLSVSAPHPFAAIGTLTGASWLSVVAFHEHRHTAQIEEMRRQGTLTYG